MESLILGVIPARGGSKGIKDKNISLVAGKPLIVYTIEAALASRKLSDVLVTTDSERIADVARRNHASVPFLRPAELATDEAKTVDVVKHALLEYERLNACRVDVIVLLQPTTPLRRTEDIDAAIVQFQESPGANSLIGCYEATSVHPNIIYRPDGMGLRSYVLTGDFHHRRQEFEPVYVRNGAIYIATRDLVMDKGKMYDDRPMGYVMPRERSINIDDPLDMEIAAFLLKRRLVSGEA